jgi:hypothetical protein
VHIRQSNCKLEVYKQKYLAPFPGWGGYKPKIAVGLVGLSRRRQDEYGGRPLILRTLMPDKANELRCHKIPKALSGFRQVSRQILSGDTDQPWGAVSSSGDGAGATHEIIQPEERAYNHRSRQPAYDGRAVNQRRMHLFRRSVEAEISW